MANLYRHIHIRKLTDLLDERVDRRTSVGRVMRVSQGKDDTRWDVGAAKMHQDYVWEATTYASFAQQEVYLHKARRMDVPAYTIAIMDWFQGPRVLEIDVDAWTGEPGQTIRVKARDNIKVAGVSVVIRDARENVLEVGEAVQSETASAWWNYTTTSWVKMEPFPLVGATARDLPGNRDSFVIS